MDYMTLLGAEDVRHAANTMQEAARTFSQSVQYLAENQARHEAFMREWIERFEAVARAADTKEPNDG